MVRGAWPVDPEAVRHAGNIRTGATSAKKKSSRQALTNKTLAKKASSPHDSARRHRKRELIRTLTRKEWEIALLVSEGMTIGDIAAQLYISSHSVELSLRKIYQKLGVTSRKHLAQMILRTN